MWFFVWVAVVACGYNLETGQGLPGVFFYRQNITRKWITSSAVSSIQQELRSPTEPYPLKPILSNIYPLSIRHGGKHLIVQRLKKSYDNCAQGSLCMGE